MPDSIPLDQDSEHHEPHDAREVINTSGGVDIDANRVQVSGDVVGRDKIEHANGDIIHANIVIINDGQRVTADRVPTEPLRHYDPNLTLELPLGAVRPNSPFYIERSAKNEIVSADGLLRQQVFGDGTITTIRAGRQSGKTSLLMQGIQIAKQEGRQVVYLDFQTIESRDREQLNSLLMHMAVKTAYQLEINPTAAEEIWDSPAGPQDKFNQFLKEHVLSQASRPYLFAIDEADQLLDASCRIDFFGLVRSWNSSAAHDGIWRKLNVAMAISTHPYLLIEDPRLSPFNVGLILDLEDFNESQVAELNKRHHHPLADTDFAAAMNLLGGHPYLVRQALYTLAASRMSWASLVQVAAQDQGPFGRHLRHYLDEIVKHPNLVKALRQVIAQGTSNDENTLHRLSAAGLIKQVGDRYAYRCGLYEVYFGEKLK